MKNKKALNNDSFDVYGGSTCQMSVFTTYWPRPTSRLFSTFGPKPETILDIF